MIVRLTAGAMLMSACGTPSAPPIIATPIAATLVGGSLVLDGARFGAPDPSSKLVYLGGTTPSTDPAVTAWADTSITVVLPASARSGPLAVQTADGTSLPVQLEVYAYDFFAVPPTPSTNASPTRSPSMPPAASGTRCTVRTQRPERPHSASRYRISRPSCGCRRCPARRAISSQMTGSSSTRPRATSGSRSTSVIASAGCGGSDSSTRSRGIRNPLKSHGEIFFRARVDPREGRSSPRCTHPPRRPRCVS